eukprot:gene1773-biopygen1644
MLNLKHAARRFWSDELRHLHITHLELEAVYKTVQSFLRELTGKVVKVYRVVDKAWCTSTVGDTGPDGMTHIAYDYGDQKDLDMSKEKYEFLTELAVQMQGAALGNKTVSNYRPKARAFMAFCVAEERDWLPAAEATPDTPQGAHRHHR